MGKRKAAYENAKKVYKDVLAKFEKEYKAGKIKFEKEFPNNEELQTLVQDVMPDQALPQNIAENSSASLGFNFIVLLCVLVGMFAYCRKQKRAVISEFQEGLVRY